ncbi:MAG: PAS domain S-box protein, partial [Candidatus Heimdallarchaeota archaeon]|nr:PAS domain S-box protein [Candidatus Heimdallarchaeota archaeon]
MTNQKYLLAGSGAKLIKDIYHKLIDYQEGNLIDPIDQKRKEQTLLLSLVAISIAVVSKIIGTQTLGDEDAILPDSYFWVSLIGFLIIYFIARYYSYDRARYLIVGFLIVGSLLTYEQYKLDSRILYFPILIILVVSILLDSRAVAIVAGINLITMIYLFNNTTNELSSAEFYFGPIFNLIIGTILLVVYTNNMRQVAHLRNIQIVDNEQRFRNIFKYAGAGIVTTKFDGDIIQANKQFCDMLGYSEEEVVGKKWIDITHIDDVKGHLDAITKLRNNHDMEHFELQMRYYTKDKSIVWGDLTVSIIFDSNNQPNYLISVITDVTTKIEDQMEMEEKQAQLIQAQKMEAIGRLSGSVAHDFNN